MMLLQYLEKEPRAKGLGPFYIIHSPSMRRGS